MSRERILITGVSSGLGHGLAKCYLNMGAEVYGCSRRSPEDLIEQGLNFCALDLSQQAESEPDFSQWIEEVEYSYAVLCSFTYNNKFFAELPKKFKKLYPPRINQKNLMQTNPTG